MLSLLTLVLSLGVILAGAEGFTNAVEWLGKKLRLSHGAVGSILAAVGTAMPETLIPVIAIVLGRGAAEAEGIGIGAILGAPFMLSTLAFFIVGLAALVLRHDGAYRTSLRLDAEIIRRDLRFFLIVYLVAILAAFLPTRWPKVLTSAGLVAAYLVYAHQTIKGGRTQEDGMIPPLHFAPRSADPAMAAVVWQVFASLGAIVVGARLFVTAVESVSAAMGVPAFVLSLVIAPVATELPEKFNSVIWLRQGKDTLALGNITGAMVFQSSIVPTVGILLTPWRLDGLAVGSALAALASAGLAAFTMARQGEIRPPTLLVGGFFYLGFIVAIFYRQTDNPWYALLFAPYAAVHWLLVRRYTRNLQSVRQAG